MMDWKKYGQSQAGIAKNFTNHKGGYKESSRKGMIGRNTSKHKFELERIQTISKKKKWELKEQIQA